MVLPVSSSRDTTSGKATAGTVRTSAQRVFELDRRRTAVAVAGLAAEGESSGESEVDVEVLRNGGLEVGADVDAVEVGLAADLVDVALAGIADVAAVLEFLRASVDGYVGFVVGPRVGEHHAAVIDIGVLQVIGVLAGEACDRLVGVDGRVAAVDARLVVEPGVFDAVDPFGKTVHDADAAFESEPDGPAAGQSAPRGDVQHAVGRPRSEQRLVGHVADERHAFDLLGIELQLGDVGRHAVDDIRRGETAHVEGRAGRFSAVVHAGDARQLAHGESGDDPRERVAEVVGRVFVDVLLVVGRGVACRCRLAERAAVGHVEFLVDAHGPSGSDEGVGPERFHGRDLFAGTRPGMTRGAVGRRGEQQRRAYQDFVAVFHSRSGSTKVHC